MIENPEISIDYSLSYSEFIAGQKLAVRQSVFPLIIHILARFIAPTIVALLVLMCLVNFFGGHKSTIPPILPLIFLLSLMPSVIWISWRYSYNRLRLSSLQSPLMTFQADKTSFARHIHQMGNLTWLWSASNSIVQNNRVVLIAARKGCFIIIPRRVVTDPQIARLNELLKENKRPSC
jgi:hypothetical protein